MINITDQLGKEFTFNEIPKRIVSIVPSQTEYLFSIGLGEHIVGITKFCIHPEEIIANKTIVGGTKNLNIEKIIALNPDIIIANKEENELSQIQELQKHFPVWISDIYTLDEAYDMMRSLGELFQKQVIAEEIILNIRESFVELKSLIKPTNERVAYFIWRNPTMLAGTNTFIHYLLEFIGFKNICSDLENGSRYPSVKMDDINRLQPDRIMLSSEPFPFNEKHIEELSYIWPHAKVELVDGEMFSWYGSRLMESAAYFKKLLETHN